MRTDLVIVGGARTAMAEYSGTPGFGKFKDITAIDLAAHAAKAALQRSGVAPEMVDETFVGNVTQSSPDAIYGARRELAWKPTANAALFVYEMAWKP